MTGFAEPRRSPRLTEAAAWKQTSQNQGGDARKLGGHRSGGAAERKQNADGSLKPFLLKRAFSICRPTGSSSDRHRPPYGAVPLARIKRSRAHASQAPSVILRGAEFHFVLMRATRSPPRPGIRLCAQQGRFGGYAPWTVTHRRAYSERPLLPSSEEGTNFMETTGVSQRDSCSGAPAISTAAALIRSRIARPICRSAGPE